LRREPERRNAAIKELTERRWLSFDGNRLALVEHSKNGRSSLVATATSATFATSSAPTGGKSSRSIKSSSSNSPKPSFSELALSSPPPVTTAPPAPALDSQSIDDWSAAYEAADHLLTGTDEVKF